MLKHLVIRNFALIEELEIDLDGKLNILTGETGAGKSIILGAIGLLTGTRADVKTLSNPDEKCLVEGVFSTQDLDLKSLFESHELDLEPETILRREIAPSGKSRAFVNDTPVTLEVLKEIATRLIDVHSQHDTQLLGTNDFQLNIIDSLAQNLPLKQRYLVEFQEFQHVQKQLEDLKSQSAQNQKEFEFNSFMLNELTEAKIKMGETVDLEAELQVLSHSEELQQKLAASVQILDETETAIMPQITALAQFTQTIAKISPTFEDLKNRVGAIVAELKDITAEMHHQAERVEMDPERLQIVNDRLALLHHLQKKHHVTDEAALLNLQADLEVKVNSVLNLEGEVSRLKEKLKSHQEAVQATGEVLSVSRISEFQKFEKEVQKLLVELGIPNANFQVNHSIGKPTNTGFDEVSFVFSANKGSQMQPLKAAASGGEFARLMMAVKYLVAQKKQMPTLIFDEIDTGISGEIAIKMGNLMKEMAAKHQVLAITHLHQIAGKGHAHFYVFKDHSSAKTVSKIKILTTAERIEEIAKMIGGATPSESAYASAKELLEV